MDVNKKNKTLYKLAQLLKCDKDTLNKLSIEQVEYINQHLGRSSYLEACPGSGKTEVIGLKGAYEAKRWKNVDGGMAVVTFTTSAAKEINNRIRKYADLTTGLFPHFIGTFDSWLHNFILQPFSHYLTNYPGKEGDKSIRIIEDDSHADFLFNFTVNIRFNGHPIPIKATEYHYSIHGNIIGHSKLAKGIIATGISAVEKEALKVNKNKFFKAGFATYADAEMICNYLLTNNQFLVDKLSKRFPVIIIDECQDLSESQLEILEHLRSAGTILHLVGDLNQSIYEFREVNPETIINYINSKHLIKLKLTNNYRSCQQIVDVFEAIIGNQNNILGNVTPITAAPCVLWQYTDQTFSLLPTKFAQFLSNNNLQFNNSAIVARGKSTLQPLRTQANNFNFSKMELLALAIECWHRPNKTTEDLVNAFFYFGKAICWLAYSGQGDAKNQFCPKNFNPVDWRSLLNKMLVQSTSLYPFEENGVDINWTRWIAKLKQFMQVIWPLLKGSENDYNDITGKLRAPSKRAGNPVKEIGNNSNTQNIFRTTTIHSVKGETLDAILLISHKDRRSQGGHYSDWLREGAFNEEHLRFAYVACSRPRYILALATPVLSNADLIKLQNLGFDCQP